MNTVELRGVFEVAKQVVIETLITDSHGKISKPMAVDLIKRIAASANVSIEIREKEHD